MRYSATVFLVFLLWACNTPSHKDHYDNNYQGIIDFAIKNPIYSLTSREKITAISGFSPDNTSQLLCGTENGKVFLVDLEKGSDSLIWQVAQPSTEKPIYQILPYKNEFLFAVRDGGLQTMSHDTFIIDVPGEPTKRNYSPYTSLIINDTIYCASSNGVHLFIPKESMLGTRLLHPGDSTDSRRLYGLYYSKSKKDRILYAAGEAGLFKINLEDRSDTTCIDPCPMHYLEAYRQDNSYGFILYQDGSLKMLSPEDDHRNQLLIFGGAPTVFLHTSEESAPDKEGFVPLKYNPPVDKADWDRRIKHYAYFCEKTHTVYTVNVAGKLSAFDFSPSFENKRHYTVEFTSVCSDFSGKTIYGLSGDTFVFKKELNDKHGAKCIRELKDDGNIELLGYTKKALVYKVNNSLYLLEDNGKTVPIAKNVRAAIVDGDTSIIIGKTDAIERFNTVSRKSTTLYKKAKLNPDYLRVRGPSKVIVKPVNGDLINIDNDSVIPLKVPVEGIKDIAISPDGNLLYLLKVDSIQLFNLNNRELQNLYALPSWATGFDRILCNYSQVAVFKMDQGSGIAWKRNDNNTVPQSFQVLKNIKAISNIPGGGGVLGTEDGFVYWSPSDNGQGDSVYVDSVDIPKSTPWYDWALIALGVLGTLGGVLYLLCFYLPKRKLKQKAGQENLTRPKSKTKNKSSSNNPKKTYFDELFDYIPVKKKQEYKQKLLDEYPKAIPVLNEIGELVYDCIKHKDNQFDEPFFMEKRRVFISLAEQFYYFIDPDPCKKFLTDRFKIKGELISRVKAFLILPIISRENEDWVGWWLAPRTIPYPNNYDSPKQDFDNQRSSLLNCDSNYFVGDYLKKAENDCSLVYLIANALNTRSRETKSDNLSHNN